jgi:hypothetical protein
MKSAILDETEAQKHRRFERQIVETGHFPRMAELLRY